MDWIAYKVNAARINSSVSFLLLYVVQEVKFDNRKVSKCEKHLLVGLK